MQEYSSDIGQIKILASEKILEDFKKIVLAKHGKLELSEQGEEALNMYIKRYDYLLKEITTAYKRKPSEYWNRILNSKPIFRQREAVHMIKMVEQLRK